MRSRCWFLLVALPLAIPVAAIAAPFETPPHPDVPLGPPSIEHPPEVTPPVAAPPFDFEVPSPPASPPDLPFDVPFDLPQGPPDPLPSADAGIPDLVGQVDLPEAALEHVVDQAPPFGGEHGSDGVSFTITVVPEPATGALITLGLAALALRRRATS